MFISKQSSKVSIRNLHSRLLQPWSHVMVFVFEFCHDNNFLSQPEVLLSLFIHN